ncbi:MAG: vWA domain-containing protein [Candidatus Limnocylindrales bacterium]
MSFAWPVALLLLALIPAGILAYRAIGRRRVRRMGGLAVPPRGPASRGARARAAVPTALFVLALVAMVVAVARPQGTVSLPIGQGTVVLAFDVSGSMAATDQSPTRLDAAKAIATDFVQHEPPGIAIGVVAFSDAGIAVQAASTDQGEVLAAIKQLAPQKGTALGQGIEAALRVISVAEAGASGDYYTNASPAPSATATPAPVPPGSHASAAIVLLTDGENNENPDPLTIAQQAADLGIRVDTVAVGTAQGADLNLNGFHVHSQLNEALLQQIATLTAGTYFGTEGTASLTDVYTSIQPTVTVQPQTIELTGIAAGAALVLLAAGIVASLALLGRMP